MMTTIALKARLAELGYWDGLLGDPSYGPKTRQAVARFQAQHLGPARAPLRVTGQVDVGTEWALANPTGPAQRSYLPSNQIPAGIGPQRRRILEVALEQHGIAERPPGSNRGQVPNGGVDKFLPSWAITEPGPAWCCFFVSWVCKEALGRYPLGRVQGSCTKAWSAALGLGIAQPKTEAARPRPGDAFLIAHGADMAHIGFVYRVAADGSAINTVEGNCGNRVKVGKRSLLDASIAGWIDMVPDELERGELGLVEAGEVGRDATR
jgi:peptidoglycan hydrolase-like protein with peptidoglycan-binding domain